MAEKEPRVVLVDGWRDAWRNNNCKWHNVDKHPSVKPNVVVLFVNLIYPTLSRNRQLCHCYSATYYTGMFPVGDTSSGTLIAVCVCVCVSVCLSVRRHIAILRQE